MTDNQHACGLQLARLVDCGAHRFDPVRFRYIQSLINRSAGLGALAARPIIDKAKKSIDVYEARYEKAREHAEDIVDRVCSQYPGETDRVHRLFDQGDFKAVQRLSQKLHRSSGHDRQGRMFAALIHQITQGGALANGGGGALSLEEILRRQEKEILDSADPSMEGDPPVSDDLDQMLAAFRLFKGTWSKLYANELVTHAIKTRPEDPGPLNGQMLATRCLSAMRQLSPNYLNRFVAYMDTLLWLQQACNDVDFR